VSGYFDVRSRQRKAADRTAYQRARGVFNKEVRKGFGIGRAYDAGDDDLGILMSCLVLIELYNTHDF
jgi:hypothetical protein